MNSVARPRYQVDYHVDPLAEELACLYVLREEVLYPEYGALRAEVREVVGEVVWEEIGQIYTYYYQWKFLADLGPYCARQNPLVDGVHQGSFAEGIARLRALSDNDFALYMLGLEVDDEDYTKDLFVNREKAEKRLRELYGEVMDQRAVNTIFQDCARLREQVVSLLEDFWELFFAREWERIRPALLQAAQRRQRQRYGESLETMLSAYDAFLTRSSEGAFVFQDQQEFSLRPQSIQQVHIFFSAYMGERLFYNLVGDELLLHQGVDVDRPLSPPEVDGMLQTQQKALGDPQRLRILRLLCEREMTTGELAATLDLADSTVSAHLKLLKEGQLVQSERYKQNVYYRGNKAAVEDYSHQLQRYLHMGEQGGAGERLSRGRKFYCPVEQKIL